MPVALTFHDAFYPSRLPTMAGSPEMWATVVLQGTGQPSPSVGYRRRFERFSAAEIAEAQEWSKHQSESFQLPMPKRMSNEPSATAEQIAAIQNHVRFITGPVMENLGANQAAFLINEIKGVQDLFSELKVHEYLDRPQYLVRLLLVVYVALLAYLLFHAHL